MKPSFLRLMVAAAAFAVAAPSFPAFAQGKKAAPKKAAEKPAPKAAPKAGEKPAEAKKAEPEERKGPAAFQQAAPRDFDESKAAAADKKRDEAIEALKRIIPRIEDGSPQKADLLFQLAELYWEKQKFLALKANARFSKDIEAATAAMNRGEKVPDPKLDLRESELYRSETMRLYETILRDYPAYHRKDEVLFALGYNLYELGGKKNRTEAVKRYEDLTKNYPDSRFLADTYVQLANHWFDDNNLAKAKENYEKALKTQNPEIYGYALYKLAWCDFNTGDYEKGLKKFHDVVDYSEKQGKGGQLLKTEALRDMVLTYVQLNRPDDAVDYFKRKAPKNRQARLVAGLANGLADAGHHESAIKVFRGLVNDEPNRAEAPEFQQSIIKSYEKLRQRDQVRSEVKKLAELYRPGSSWWKANESKPVVLKTAFEVSEEAMRSVVTEYHQEAQKTKQVETYRLARDIYKQYIDSFATSENPEFVSDHAFNMLYFYGDILWALEEWQPAAEAYERVVAFKVPERDLARELYNEKYRQESAYNAILGYEKLVKIERGELKQAELKDGQKIVEKGKKGEVERKKQVTKRSAKELEAQPLTKYEQKLVAVCDTYNQLFPDNKDEIDVRYQAAVIYYDRNHFVDAGRRFAEIINKWPEEKRSREAADLTMAVLEEKEEWLELNKISRTFAANKKLVARDAEFARRVGGVVEGSQYKYVDEVVYKKEKNPGRAAELFLEFVKEFPKSDNADRALTYSMIIFQDAVQIDRGIDAGERVLKEYKESPFELKVLFSLAKFYEQTAQFRKSALKNEEFIAATDLATGVTKPAAGAGKKAAAPKGKAPAKSVLSSEELKALHDEAKGWLSDAHFNAALWWEGLGENDKAIAAWTTYLTRFKDAKDVPDIHFNIGLIYDTQKKWADSIKQFEAFNKTFEKDKRTTAAQHYRAKYRQWKAHRELKNDRELARLQTELLRGYGSLPAEDKKDRRVLNAFANMRFLESETQWKQYTDIKFTKVATLKKDFASKGKKIQDIEKMYTDILAIGDGEFGIAALTRIGLAYADFAQNIVSSPDPRGLDEEQLDMYRSELENMAFPLEEKAIEALEKATDKAYELNIYNEWTLLAQDRINKYRPGFYAKPVPVQSFQGSEFFVTAPVQKEFQIATQSSDPAPAPEEKAKTTPPPTAAAGQH
jgi:tetratricopeptide (TPR) repeat protein